MNSRPLSSIENTFESASGSSRDGLDNRYDPALYLSRFRPGVDGANGATRESTTTSNVEGNHEGSRGVNVEVDGRYRLIARILSDIGALPILPSFVARNFTDARVLFDENNNLQPADVVMDTLFDNDVVPLEFILVIGDYISDVLADLY